MAPNKKDAFENYVAEGSRWAGTQAAVAALDSLLGLARQIEQKVRDGSYPDDQGTRLLAQFTLEIIRNGAPWSAFYLQRAAIGLNTTSSRHVTEIISFKEGKIQYLVEGVENVTSLEEVQALVAETIEEYLRVKPTQRLFNRFYDWISRALKMSQSEYP